MPLGQKRQMHPRLPAGEIVVQVTRLLVDWCLCANRILLETVIEFDSVPPASQ
jgi:hypothetical protein